MNRLLIFVLCCFPHLAQATILTFEDVGSVFSPISQDYGDNVVEEITSNGRYGKGNGFTPNIEVAYASRSADPAVNEDFLRYWQQDYGDLVDIAMPAYFQGTAEIILTPQPGWGVSLNSFQMATWFGSSHSLDLAVFDLQGNELWSSAIQELSGRGHHQFNPAVSSTDTLRILWGNSWDIGIDNVNFDQYLAVTEPGMLMLFGLLGLYARRRSQQRNPAPEIASVIS